MKIKNNYIVFLLILTIVILIGIYWASFLRNSSDIKQNSETVNHGWNRYVNNDWNLRIEYPQGWFEKANKGGESTPFGMTFSDDQDFIESGKLTPNQSPPEKLINFVLYKTDQTIDEYSFSEVTSKKISNVEKDDTVISGVRALKIKGMVNQYTYLATYIKKGEYLYIFESTIRNKADISDVENVYNSMVSSLSI